ncbi:hypothetical protein IP69_20065 [Bosea sp. AAP35]|nr:hypothetical protein IP69_20065 [Bosea sp. AAP35]
MKRGRGSKALERELCGDAPNPSIIMRRSISDYAPAMTALCPRLTPLRNWRAEPHLSVTLMMPEHGSSGSPERKEFPFHALSVPLVDEVPLPVSRPMNMGCRRRPPPARMTLAFKDVG